MKKRESEENNIASRQGAICATRAIGILVSKKREGMRWEDWGRSWEMKDTMCLALGIDGYRKEVDEVSFMGWGGEFSFLEMNYMKLASAARARGLGQGCFIGQGVYGQGLRFLFSFFLYHWERWEQKGTTWPGIAQREEHISIAQRGHKSNHLS